MATPERELTGRQAVEAKALELYPVLDYRSMPSCVSTHDSQQRRREAWVRGRTVPAEELEAAAKAWSDAEVEAYGVGPCPWEARDPQEQDYTRRFARAAFRAAGFIVESGE